MKKKLNLVGCLILLKASEVFAERAQIGKVEGLLKDNEKANAAIEMLNWGMVAVSVAACFAFGIKATKKLSDEDFVGAAGPGLASVLAGIIGYIVYSLAK